MLDEYYATREWDTITGRPLPEKLRALDLNTLIDDLWPDTRGGALYDGLCIRRAAAEDLPAILWLRQSMLAAMGSPLEAIRAGADEATAQVYTGETRAGRMAHFLAFSPGGEPVALAGAVIRDEFPYVVDNPRYGLIMDIYISPHYRRRGLARRMIEEVGLWLRSQGVNRAKMVPVEGVREVLERLGFEPSREMERKL
ncbi:MAG: hypothetical protein A2Z04_01470 [Chloroflexi bacterium RBG_16_57_9]|nr:MAG: hypothetical protein A2Z04_01470 [Chloroflexi bacterium RBG_16_57_9]